jgi:hypothetical protein
MITSPWNLLSAYERLMLTPKLLGIFEEVPVTGPLIEAASERFNHFVIECGPDGKVSPQAVKDHVLTAQNFIAQAGRTHSPIWRLVAEIKGIRRSYLELMVRDRHEFLSVLREADFVVNREPFWSIHKFDSARAITDYSHQPSLHFANDRADEDNYGPNYFFVHWDRTSCWFRRSSWPVRRLPGARAVEQLYAATHHRFGCACPQKVSEYLNCQD